jgi:hypothetical protein
MTVQATIPSQTFNYQRWINQSITQQNENHTLSFHESSSSRDNKRKKTIQGQKPCPRKKQENTPSTNRKEDSHNNRIPMLTRKIIGSNNYFTFP